MKIKRTINIIIIVFGFSLIVNYFIYDNVKKTVNNVEVQNKLIDAEAETVTKDKKAERAEKKAEKKAARKAKNEETTSFGDDIDDIDNFD